MSFNIINEDLRSIKTERALYAAMVSLLEKFNFKKITVKGICEESLISRAAFYAHFIDKYDLLKRWIEGIWLKNFDVDNNYEQIESLINCNMNKNIRILKNLISEADSETSEILFDFILSTQNLQIEKDGDKEVYQRNVVLSNFYAGGIIAYLTWHIKNKFSTDVPLINKNFYEMVKNFQELLIK